MDFLAILLSLGSPVGAGAALDKAYQRGRDDAFDKIEQKINSARYDTNINRMEYFRNLIKEARDGK